MKKHFVMIHKLKLKHIFCGQLKMSAICMISEKVSLSEGSLSRFFLFLIFLIDEIDLGQVYRVHDPKVQIKTV